MLTWLIIVAFKIIIRVDLKARLREFMALSRVTKVTVKDVARTTFIVIRGVNRIKKGISMYIRLIFSLTVT